MFPKTYKGNAMNIEYFKGAPGPPGPPGPSGPASGEHELLSVTHTDVEHTDSNDIDDGEILRWEKDFSGTTTGRWRHSSNKSVFMGWGTKVPASQKCVAIGYNVGTATQTSGELTSSLKGEGNIAIGVDSLNPITSDTSFFKNIAIGNGVLRTSNSNNNIGIGTDIAVNGLSYGWNVFLGTDIAYIFAGQRNISLGNNNSRLCSNYNIVIGNESGERQGYNLNHKTNIAIGMKTGLHQVDRDIAIGDGAGKEQGGRAMLTNPNGTRVTTFETCNIALGDSSGTKQYYRNNIAIGKNSGLNQYEDCVAIGTSAGTRFNSTSRNINIGYKSGNDSYCNDSVSIGTLAGNNQNDHCISVGTREPPQGLNQQQLDGSMSLGYNSGLRQGYNSIAFGTNSGRIQGENCIALGAQAGVIFSLTSLQADNSTFIGYQAGLNSPGALNGVALGYQAGMECDQKCISLGNRAGYKTSGKYSISLGYFEENRERLVEGEGVICIGNNNDQNIPQPLASYNKTKDNSIVLGNNNSFFVDKSCIVVGSYNSSRTKILENNIVIGTNNFESNENIASSLDLKNVIIGNDNLSSSSSDKTNITSTMIFGNNCLYSTTKTTKGVFIGNNSGTSKTIAGVFEDEKQGDECIIINCSTTYSAMSTKERNVIINTGNNIKSNAKECIVIQSTRYTSINSDDIEDECLYINPIRERALSDKPMTLPNKLPEGHNDTSDLSLLMYDKKTKEVFGLSFT